MLGNPVWCLYLKLAISSYACKLKPLVIIYHSSDYGI